MSRELSVKIISKSMKSARKSKKSTKEQEKIKYLGELIRKEVLRVIKAEQDNLKKFMSESTENHSFSKTVLADRPIDISKIKYYLEGKENKYSLKVFKRFIKAQYYTSKIYLSNLLSLLRLPADEILRIYRLRGGIRQLLSFPPYSPFVNQDI